MLFTHITQDCITKQCVKNGKTSVPSLAEPSHPIVHELATQKVSQPSAPAISQATAPCTFLDLKLKSQVWKCCNSLKYQRQNDNTPLYVLIKRDQCKHKVVKIQAWNTLTALNAKMQEPVLSQMYFDVEGQLYIWITCEQQCDWKLATNVNENASCLSLVPPLLKVSTNSNSNDSHHCLCKLDWPALW